MQEIFCKPAPSLAVLEVAITCIAPEAVAVRLGNQHLQDRRPKSCGLRRVGRLILQVMSRSGPVSSHVLSNAEYQEAIGTWTCSRCWLWASQQATRAWLDSVMDKPVPKGTLDNRWPWDRHSGKRFCQNGQEVLLLEPPGCLC